MSNPPLLATNQRNIFCNNSQTWIVWSVSCTWINVHQRYLLLFMGQIVMFSRIAAHFYDCWPFSFPRVDKIVLSWQCGLVTQLKSLFITVDPALAFTDHMQRLSNRDHLENIWSGSQSVFRFSKAGSDYRVILRIFARFETRIPRRELKEPEPESEESFPRHYFLTADGVHSEHALHNTQYKATLKHDWSGCKQLCVMKWCC